MMELQRTPGIAMHVEGRQAVDLIDFAAMFARSIYADLAGYLRVALNAEDHD
jgi:hypothetical protein